jgi:hypothetical protein
LLFRTFGFGWYSIKCVFFSSKIRISYLLKFSILNFRFQYHTHTLANLCASFFFFFSYRCVSCYKYKNHSIRCTKQACTYTVWSCLHLKFNLFSLICYLYERIDISKAQMPAPAYTHFFICQYLLFECKYMYFFVILSRCKKRKKKKSKYWERTHSQRIDNNMEIII